MKRTLKLLGIIAAVAVMGLSMVGCDNGNGGGGGAFPAALVGIWQNASYDSIHIGLDSSSPTGVWLDFVIGTNSGSSAIRATGNIIRDDDGDLFQFALSNNDNTLTITNGNVAWFGAGINGVWTREE